MASVPERIEIMGASDRKLLDSLLDGLLRAGFHPSVVLAQGGGWVVEVPSAEAPHASAALALALKRDVAPWEA